MKQNLSSDRNDPLGRVLAEWKVESQQSPGFKEQVWRRIEREESVRIGSWRRNWLQWLDGVFARPAPAFAYLAILLVVGLSIGAMQARRDSARMDDTLQARYLRTVDPYFPQR